MEYTDISKADKDQCKKTYVCAMRLDHDGVRLANIELLQRRYRSMTPTIRQRAKASVQNLLGQMGQV